MVVALEDLVCGFGEVPIVAAPRLEASRGERIVIVGPNGAGKTTLLRTIAGELAPLAVFLRLVAGVQPGYLAQFRRAGVAGTTVLERAGRGQRRYWPGAQLPGPLPVPR